VRNSPGTAVDEARPLRAAVGWEMEMAEGERKE